MKRLLFLLFCLISFAAVAVTPSYVVITYHVAMPSGAYFPNIDATARILYDTSTTVAHSNFAIKGKYDAETGDVTWTLPTTATCEFVCAATGLRKTVDIPDAAADLNSLVPAVAGPQPSWTELFWGCAQQPECDIVTDYDVDCVDGRFSGDVAITGTAAAASAMRSPRGSRRPRRWWRCRCRSKSPHSGASCAERPLMAREPSGFGGLFRLWGRGGGNRSDREGVNFPRA